MLQRFMSVPIHDLDLHWYTRIIFVFFDLRLEVVVRFVINRIVDHHC
jgi:hypothetical protein